jgi:hypothetical protein
MTLARPIARIVRRNRPLMLDMRVIFTDVPAGLRDLPSVETEGSAWLLLIRV